MLTQQEKEVMEKTSQLWNDFIRLPVEHPSEVAEFAHHLHILQNIILSRSGYREINTNIPERIVIVSSTIEERPGS